MRPCERESKRAEPVGGKKSGSFGLEEPDDQTVVPGIGSRPYVVEEEHSVPLFAISSWVFQEASELCMKLETQDVSHRPSFIHLLILILSNST